MAFTVPALLRLNEVPTSAKTLHLWGASTITLAALTDFELGAARVIPMRAHLTVDAMVGPALAAGPWLLGGATAGRRHWVPHVLIGGTEFVLAFTTRTQPSSGALVVQAVCYPFPRNVQEGYHA